MSRAATGSETTSTPRCRRSARFDRHQDFVTPGGSSQGHAPPAARNRKTWLGRESRGGGQQSVVIAMSARSRTRPANSYRYPGSIRRGQRVRSSTTARPEVFKRLIREDAAPQRAPRAMTRAPQGCPPADARPLPVSHDRQGLSTIPPCPRAAPGGMFTAIEQRQPRATP